ncbi:MAG: hydantoinase B/oxoprolinase family protein [Deltaproteobacteria bacterium]|nr:hydantoinase B/oxoprolinase family protein [Deltaproteobacteria bacterium]MBW1960080.1 hydantoinase B/oxoprolinase family protein [Deltaproteobacteria bacterium]MBW2152665.1 hydantoinase B/oxoprolinase family protein [Deltaproteobacteria bacterium]
MAKVIPERVIAACHGTIAGYTVHGFDSRLKELYTYSEIIGGGFGAICRKDGPDGVQVHMTNTSNLPVECLEYEYPIIKDCPRRSQKHLSRSLGSSKKTDRFCLNGNAAYECKALK